MADLVDERWPLEMINNSLWKQYVCKPDFAMRRMAWKIAQKMEFCYNGVAGAFPTWLGAAQPGKQPAERYPNSLSFPEKSMTPLSA